MEQVRQVVEKVISVGVADGEPIELAVGQQRRKSDLDCRRFTSILGEVDRAKGQFFAQRLNCLGGPVGAVDYHQNMVRFYQGVGAGKRRPQ